MSEHDNGPDVNAEGPTHNRQPERYNALLEELRTVLAAADLEMTAAPVRRVSAHA